MTARDRSQGTTEGRFVPETWAEAEARYERLGPTAQTVVRETAKAMSFDREEYDRRVTSEVVATARRALFADSLAVRTADRSAFEGWREEYAHEIHVAGSDAVGRVAWHASPPAEAAVAATFENEPEAAADTVRRMAFNRLYRERLAGEPA